MKKLEIDLGVEISEDKENGGYLLPIKTQFEIGDWVGDIISLDVESQSIWFRYGLIHILEAGWNDEEYQEVRDMLKLYFDGNTATAILGRIRRFFI